MDDGGGKADVFGAIAEPRRREIVELLAKRGALAVGAIVMAVGLPQPAVSKHLGVLREAGVVSVEKAGQRRVYRLEARGLRVMYDWVRQYEAFWTDQLDRVKERAERMARELDSRSEGRGSSRSA